MKRSLAQLFRRPVKSNAYLPQVDGIRFIAITWVFLLHASFYTAVSWGRQPVIAPFWRMILGGGDKGVYVFFMLSGFIIALPFTKHYLQNAPKIKLGNFYIRRIIRLEPPYFISMAVIAMAMIISKSEHTFEILKHLGISLAYLHNFIYHSSSTINQTSWSLEVELQFYLLAPLLAGVFTLKQTLRRLLLAGGALVFCLAQFKFQVSFVSLYQHFHLFLMGMLLADFYTTGFPAFIHTKKASFLAALLFMLLIWLPIHTHRWATAIFPFATAVWMALCLANEQVKKLLSVKWLSIIGGMCYTIYLIHNPLLELIAKYCSPSAPTDSFIRTFAGHLCIYIPITLAVTAIFYLLVEKPFMKLAVYLTTPSGERADANSKTDS